MHGLWKRFAVAGGLAISLVAWGCESPTAPPVAGETYFEAPADEPGSELRPVHWLGSTLREITETEIIGPLGGALELLGHRLVVPAGAVSRPTLFAMIVLPGERVEVELFAWDGVLGLNAGSGFAIPVQLSLSYAKTDVDDPEDLVIVHILRDGTRIPLPSTVDTGAELVTAELEHFSRYGLCSN